MTRFNLLCALALATACLFASRRVALAETGADAWLRYAPLEGEYADDVLRGTAGGYRGPGDSPLIQSATDELVRGVRGMTGRTLSVVKEMPDEPAIVVGTVVDAGFVRGGRGERDDSRAPDGYHVFFRERDGHKHLFVVGTNYRSALYAAFVLLRSLGTNQPLESHDERSFAYAPIRWSTTGTTSTARSSAAMRGDRSSGRAARSARI